MCSVLDHVSRMISFGRRKYCTTSTVSVDAFASVVSAQQEQKTAKQYSAECTTVTFL